MIETVAATVFSYLQYLKALTMSFVPRRAGLVSSTSNEKHLILVTWAFPPVVSGGVYRPLSFVRTAALNGWKVSVICGPGPADADAAGAYLEQQIPQSVSIHRIARPKLQPSYNWFPRIDGGLLNALSIADCPVTRHNGTVIVASGPPFSSFVGAWFLSRKLGAPLVLDYRDEWTQCPFEFVTASDHDVFWERRCLRAAASVLVTTRSFGRQIESAFPFVSQEKIRLVPNGYEPSDFILSKSPASDASVTADGSVTIAYLGYLAEHVDPDEFIRTLEQALALEPRLGSELRIRFIGKRNPTVERKFLASTAAGMIQFADQVSKQNAAQIMCESRAVLLFNPPRLARYLPGKLFDYIASGAEMLVYGRGGEIEDAVIQSSTGRVVAAGDPVALAQALVRLVQDTPSSGGSDRREWLRTHERGRVADALLEHLEGIRTK